MNLGRVIRHAVLYGLLITCGTVVAGPTYSIVDLGNGTKAYAINSAGQIAGVMDSANGAINRSSVRTKAIAVGARSFGLQGRGSSI